MSIFNGSTLPEFIRDAPPVTDPRFLRLWTVEPPIIAVVALIGPTQAVLAGGVGGWKEIARPKRQSLTDYEGTPLTTLKVEIILDGFQEEASVEGDIATLIKMSTKNARLGRPPVVAMGGAVPRGNVGMWVLNDIDWGAVERRSSDAYVIRQFVTLTFMEYVPAIATTWAVSGPANDAQARHDAEAAAAAAAASKQAAEDAEQLDPDNQASVGDIVGTEPSPVSPLGQTVGLIGGITGIPVNIPTTAGQTVYTVRAGDTLATIAAKELGDADRWQEIADLNGIDNPRDVFVGRILILPPSGAGGGGGGGSGW